MTGPVLGSITKACRFLTSLIIAGNVREKTAMGMPDDVFALFRVDLGVQIMMGQGLIPNSITAPGRVLSC